MSVIRVVQHLRVGELHFSDQRSRKELTEGLKLHGCLGQVGSPTNGIVDNRDDVPVRATYRDAVIGRRENDVCDQVTVDVGEPFCSRNGLDGAWNQQRLVGWLLIRCIRMNDAIGMTEVDQARDKAEVLL